ncbi:MAG TPA: transaldolase [Burkholderiaceae bacterium]|nr:transaldolase [Burkholderiaceae bacterium]
MNPSSLKSIRSFGQSVWLDYLDRKLIDSGALRRLIEEDGVAGVTTNPAIFEKSINGSDHYDRAIAAWVDRGASSLAIYRNLTVRDVVDAAGLLRPLYETSDGTDGFVSLEVSPHLAHDTQGTVREARELWGALDRPNVLIKVPATRAGLPAIRTLLAEGINVNVTLLFGLTRYTEVAQAYLAALEDRVQANRSVRHVVSVASFFLSRIDSMVDPMLDALAKRPKAPAPEALKLKGETAIACAKLAYRQYRSIFFSPRFDALAKNGARTQRLLWASTSTKNAAYSDIKYVEPLIGADTVNTMPLETLDAYRDHGRPATRLGDDLAHFEEVLARLPGFGIDAEAVAQRLEDEGVQKFVAPYDLLLASMEKKTRAQRSEYETTPLSVKEK